MNKPYLIIKDKSGELVAKRPTMEKPKPPKINTGHEWNDANYGASEKYYQNAIRLYDKHLLELPSLHLDPSIKGKEGDRVDGREVKQSWGIVNATDAQHWKDIDESEYRICPPDRRRITLKAVEGEKPISQQLKEIWTPVDTNVNMLRTEDGAKEWERLRDLFQEKTSVPTGEQGLKTLACFIEGYNAAKEESHPDQSQEAQRQGAVTFELLFEEWDKNLSNLLSIYNDEQIDRDDRHTASVSYDRLNRCKREVKQILAAQPAEDWVAVALAELQRIYDKYGYEETGMVIRNIEALSTIK